MARSLFAHLGRTAKSKADDADDRTPKDRKDDDEAEKARKAKRKAEDKKDDEDEDDEEGTRQDKKDEEDAKASAVRGRERDRVRAILTSGPGLANPVMAAHVALDTAMPRGSAVAAISSLNAAKGIPDAEDVDGADVQASTSAMAAAIVAAGAKARGETTAAPIPPGRRERMGLRETERAAPPPRDMAAAIIEAGRKARGEI